MKNDPRDEKKVKIAGILVVVQVFGEKKGTPQKKKKKRNKKRPNYYKREIF